MRNIIFSMLIILVFASTIHAQTIEQIAKKNITNICNCIDKIDYIDGEIDFEMKIDKCMQLSEEDSIQVIETAKIYQYNNLIIEELLTSCTALEAKINELKKSYTLNYMDSIYTLEGEYKEIQKKIIGHYSLSFGNHNPEGGAHLFLEEENRYAMSWFGGAIVGTWKIVKGKYLHLNPDKPQYPFYVYGRNNPDIGDSTKMIFRGEFSYETLIHFGGIKENPLNLTPIFNDDANCKTYVSQSENIYDELSLAWNPTNEDEINQESTIYTFKNTNAFNELVICEYTGTFYSMPIRVIIDGDKLIFGENKITKRRPLIEPSPEDKELFNQITNVTDVPENIYYSDNFGEYRNRFNSDIFFDTKLNTYISLSKNSNSIYENPEDGSYSNMLRVNKFEMLQNVSLHKRQFKINEKSLIHSVCD